MLVVLLRACALELVEAIVVPDAHVVRLVRGAARQVLGTLGPVSVVVARLTQIDLLVLLGLRLEPVQRVVGLGSHVALRARVERDTLLQYFLRADQIGGADGRVHRWVLTLAERDGRLCR